MESIAFIDGACSGNPGPGGWGVIVLDTLNQITELGGGKAKTTNNEMELLAAIQALKHLQTQPGKVTLYSDSSYVIQGAEGWIEGWKKRGWKTIEGKPVSHQSLWEELDQLLGDRKKKKLALQWVHVQGHAGVAGNERADQIASAHAQGAPISLFSGSAQDYPIDLRDVRIDPKAALQKNRKNAKAFSYLSFVDGIALRHSSWAECEARVKGRAGAKFKKSTSPEDEAQILAEWGAKLSSPG